MLLVKVLKRKDASSVLVAVLLAILIWQPLTTTTGRLAGWISTTNGGPYGYGGPSMDWQTEYLMPVVWFVVQVVVLEILAWIYVFAAGALKKISK